MAEQSQFSKLSKKQLFYIAEKLIDEDFPVDNPYNSNSISFDEAYDVLENLGRYFNISVVQEDVEFFSKFLDINDKILARIMEKSDILSYEDLVIPTAQTYQLRYSVWGTCTYDDYMAQKFDSYDMDWVIDSAEQQRRDGNWDYYNGINLRETQYDNFEESDMSFDGVDFVPDNVKESLLGRLMIENTQDAVSSLDRETLLKLKSIIDSRLRSL